MKTIIDTFQNKINDNFSEFTLATSCAEAGLNLISQSRSDSTVSLYLGDDLHTEPVQFTELLDISSDFISNTVSLYQNMMVAAWSDLLDDLFNYYLELHFSGNFSFLALKTKCKNRPRFQIISATFMGRCRRGSQLLKVVRSSRQRNKQYYHELSAVDRGQKIPDFCSFGTGNFSF